MKTPSFFEGVGIALVSALLGSILFAFLPQASGSAFALKVMLSVLTTGYLWYLLRRSDEHVGRLVVALAWLLAMLAAWLWAPSVLVFSLLNAGMIWLVRSLYFYNGFLASLADLLLTLFGLAAACWAMFSTQSLFLSIWCFFLVQALFPNLLSVWQGNPANPADSVATDDAFNGALKIAESAIQKRSTPKTTR